MTAADAMMLPDARSSGPVSRETGAGVRLAMLIALATPALLLAGAYIGEYAFHLAPCEMCWWQRYPHFVAIVPAALAIAMPGARRPLVALAAVAILVSGLIGGFHAGVEWHWWTGPSACASTALPSGGDPLAAIMAAPVVRCDVAQWRLLGVSLAGWNFVASTGAASTIAGLLARYRRAPR